VIPRLAALPAVIALFAFFEAASGLGSDSEKVEESKYQNARPQRTQ